MSTKILKTCEVETMPDVFEQGVIYVSRKFELAIHLCACGCGEQTVTPFDDGTRGWVLTDGADGVTLRPSIGNQNFACKSHYWLTNGMIQHC